MKRETAILLSIAVLTGTLTAYAISKKRPYIASAIMGSFSALGLIYTLSKEGV